MKWKEKRDLSFSDLIGKENVVKYKEVYRNGKDDISAEEETAL